MCGAAVNIFKFYLTKLHEDCDRLFQHPLTTSFAPSGEVWYEKKPVGKNPLGNIMQRISKKASLSKIYTCHSVRSSTITTLFQAGISVEKIAYLTGHKNVSSLKHYVSGMSSEQKQHCSEVLSEQLFEKTGSTSPTNNLAITLAPAGDDSASCSEVTTTSTTVSCAKRSVSTSENHGEEKAKMISKFSELFGSCTFNNCEIKFC